MADKVMIGSDPITVDPELWAESGRWVKVISSNVEEIRYSKLDRFLDVMFKGESIYRYFDVPLAKAVDMFQSDSMGKWVHRQLKGKHGYKKLT